MLPFGFRIVGDCTGERRLVDAGAAFSAYCSCDDRAQVDRESYLSAFNFGTDFRQLLADTGSTRGFTGETWATFLFFDIDRLDIDVALRDARRLALLIVERYALDDEKLLIFYSGSKGFHVALPTALFAPDPSTIYHLACRRLAEALAGRAAVEIDTGIFDKVRAFRSPNSRHPKTARHKRRFALDELLAFDRDRILALAEKPEPFDLPDPPARCDQAAADWRDAILAVGRQAEVKASRRADANGAPSLNRSTLDFLRDGAIVGDRHRLLFSAAANLREFACPSALAHALLTEAGLDSGLSPSETRRQIECGLLHTGAVEPPPDAPPPSSMPTALPQPTADVQAQLAALWSRTIPPENAGDSWEPPRSELTAADLDFNPTELERP